MAFTIRWSYGWSSLGSRSFSAFLLSTRHSWNSHMGSDDIMWSLTSLTEMSALFIWAWMKVLFLLVVAWLLKNGTILIFPFILGYSMKWLASIPMMIFSGSFYPQELMTWLTPSNRMAALFSKPGDFEVKCEEISMKLLSVITIAVSLLTSRIPSHSYVFALFFFPNIYVL